MNEQLTSSVVSVLMPDRASMAGGGFLLGDNRVVTSCETVARALNLTPGAAPPADSQLLLEFPYVAPKKPVRAKLAHWATASGEAGTGAAGNENIAVLELLEPPPAEKKSEDIFSTNLPSDEHYDGVIDSLTEGELVPFFGAGVNMCGRPENVGWGPGQYLPSGAELASYLANRFSYPWAESVGDLLRVSQYVALVRGDGPLNKRLREIFIEQYPATSLHKFFARLPKILQRKTGRPSHQLIVTTNYDDVMEHAFTAEGEQFDVVTYMTGGGDSQRGKFLHWSAEGGAPVIVDKPNEYRLPLDEYRNLQRSVILKIHGAVDRTSSDGDSYVITEDHYIDYLTRSDISSLVPITLAEKLKSSNFLFLGYSLRDWNLRVILHRIWKEQQQKGSYNSWAIQKKP
ncbi:MAG TPA: SIR2 family protein, partial [Pyrinomonadaceae bacterium]|nr:SIR2 family protein [Pyrinomonadaceae bacterium]